jgi:hypothetical protein
VCRRDPVLRQGFCQSIKIDLYNWRVSSMKQRALHFEEQNILKRGSKSFHKSVHLARFLRLYFVIWITGNKKNQNLNPKLTQKSTLLLHNNHHLIRCLSFFCFGCYHSTDCQLMLLTANRCCRVLKISLKLFFYSTYLSLILSFFRS